MFNTTYANAPSGAMPTPLELFHITEFYTEELDEPVVIKTKSGKTRTIKNQDLVILESYKVGYRPNVEREYPPVTHKQAATVGGAHPLGKIWKDTQGKKYVEVNGKFTKLEEWVN